MTGEPRHLHLPVPPTTDLMTAIGESIERYRAGHCMAVPCPPWEEFTSEASHPACVITRRHARHQMLRHPGEWCEGGAWAGPVRLKRQW